MLGFAEKQILEAISRKNLMRKEELLTFLRKEGMDNGFNLVQRLESLGYISCVDAIGCYCYALTRDGSKALKSS